MSVPHPETLPSLSTREAIIDVMYRAVIAFDRNDVSLLNSAFAGEDVSFLILDRDGNREYQGISNIRNLLVHGVGPMDSTHMLSNIRVDLKDGADTASVTAYALAQHCPPGLGGQTDGPKFLVGGEYSIDFVRDATDGPWKAKKWVLDVIWKQGDASVMGS
ncbi:hypothetical protein A1O3_00613 [Capronia epimyces CBS 606.96]|uniref:SnoaL-like domain-containing protein n=1 Tax=Capronia epimyces CBS 606.96 TaxID=1182542 RepID=W9YHP1_9EURO|nr:uncharacterized protein A1O3_00613 [Capronia epimyces CBS 606.96]EXJ92063.1 hypothetical protein A1O3_00613 [Capronia epimyces CBS 606.96]